MNKDSLTKMVDSLKDSDNQRQSDKIDMLIKSLREHRKWIKDGSFMTFGIPEHECGYKHEPEKGVCDFCEMWSEGAELTGEEQWPGDEDKEAPSDSNTLPFTDDYEAVTYLESHGFGFDKPCVGNIIHSNPPELTPRMIEALNYLFDEWDYGWEKDFKTPVVQEG